jgi:hypothetical protein
MTCIVDCARKPARWVLPVLIIPEGVCQELTSQMNADHDKRFTYSIGKSFCHFELTSFMGVYAQTHATTLPPSNGAKPRSSAPQKARNARIKCVTRQRVEYLDEAGLECFVDLKECARNRVQDVKSWRVDGAREGDFRLVAKCRFLDHSPCFEFMNNRRTRFEFGSLEGAQALKSLLTKARWRVISEF